MNKLMQNYQKGLRLEFIHSCEHKFQNNFEVREIFMNDLANEYWQILTVSASKQLCQCTATMKWNFLQQRNLEDSNLVF